MVKGFMRKRIFALGMSCVLTAGLLFTDTMGLQAAQNDLGGGCRIRRNIAGYGSRC